MPQRTPAQRRTPTAPTAAAPAPARTPKATAKSASAAQTSASQPTETSAQESETAAESQNGATGREAPPRRSPRLPPRHQSRPAASGTPTSSSANRSSTETKKRNNSNNGSSSPSRGSGGAAHFSPSSTSSSSPPVLQTQRQTHSELPPVQSSRAPPPLTSPSPTGVDAVFMADSPAGSSMSSSSADGDAGPLVTPSPPPSSFQRAALTASTTAEDVDDEDALSPSSQRRNSRGGGNNAPSMPRPITRHATMPLMSLPSMQPRPVHRSNKNTSLSLLETSATATVNNNQNNTTVAAITCSDFTLTSNALLQRSAAAFDSEEEDLLNGSLLPRRSNTMAALPTHRQQQRRRQQQQQQQQATRSTLASPIPAVEVSTPPLSTSRVSTNSPAARGESPVVALDAAAGVRRGTSQRIARPVYFAGVVEAVREPEGKEGAIRYTTAGGGADAVRWRGSPLDESLTYSGDSVVVFESAATPAADNEKDRREAVRSPPPPLLSLSSFSTEHDDRISAPSSTVKGSAAAATINTAATAAALCASPPTRASLLPSRPRRSSNVRSEHPTGTSPLVRKAAAVESVLRVEEEETAEMDVPPSLAHRRPSVAGVDGKGWRSSDEKKSNSSSNGGGGGAQRAEDSTQAAAVARSSSPVLPLHASFEGFGGVVSADASLVSSSSSSSASSPPAVSFAPVSPTSPTVMAVRRTSAAATSGAGSPLAPSPPAPQRTSRRPSVAAAAAAAAAAGPHTLPFVALLTEAVRTPRASARGASGSASGSHAASNTAGYEQSTATTPRRRTSFKLSALLDAAAESSSTSTSGVGAAGGAGQRVADSAAFHHSRPQQQQQRLSRASTFALSSVSPGSSQSVSNRTTAPSPHKNTSGGGNGVGGSVRYASSLSSPSATTAAAAAAAAAEEEDSESSVASPSRCGHDALRRCSHAKGFLQASTEALSPAYSAGAATTASKRQSTAVVSMAPLTHGKEGANNSFPSASAGALSPLPSTTLLNLMLGDGAPPGPPAAAAAARKAAGDEKIYAFSSLPAEHDFATRASLPTLSLDSPPPMLMAAVAASMEQPSLAPLPTWLRSAYDTPPSQSHQQQQQQQQQPISMPPTSQWAAGTAPATPPTDQQPQQQQQEQYQRPRTSFSDASPVIHDSGGSPEMESLQSMMAAAATVVPRGGRFSAEALSTPPAAVLGKGVHNNGASSHPHEHVFVPAPAVRTSMTPPRMLWTPERSPIEQAEQYLTAPRDGWRGQRAAATPPSRFNTSITSTGNATIDGDAFVHAVPSALPPRRSSVSPFSRLSPLASISPFTGVVATSSPRGSTERPTAAAASSRTAAGGGGNGNVMATSSNRSTPSPVGFRSVAGLSGGATPFTRSGITATVTATNGCSPTATPPPPTAAAAALTTPVMESRMAATGNYSTTSFTSSLRGGTPVQSGACASPLFGGFGFAPHSARTTSIPDSVARSSPPPPRRTSSSIGSPINAPPVGLQSLTATSQLFATHRSMANSISSTSSMGAFVLHGGNTAMMLRRGLPHRVTAMSLPEVSGESRSGSSHSNTVVAAGEHDDGEDEEEGEEGEDLMSSTTHRANRRALQLSKRGATSRVKSASYSRRSGRGGRRRSSLVKPGTAIELAILNGAYARRPSAMSFYPPGGAHSAMGRSGGYYANNAGGMSVGGAEALNELLEISLSCAASFTASSTSASESYISSSFGSIARVTAAHERSPASGAWATEVSRGQGGNGSEKKSSSSVVGVGGSHVLDTSHRDVPPSSSLLHSPVDAAHSSNVPADGVGDALTCALYASAPKRYHFYCAVGAKGDDKHGSPLPQSQSQLRHPSAGPSFILDSSTPLAHQQQQQQTRHKRHHRYVRVHHRRRVDTAFGNGSGSARWRAASTSPPVSHITNATSSLTAVVGGAAARRRPSFSVDNADNREAEEAAAHAEVATPLPLSLVCAPGLRPTPTSSAMRGEKAAAAAGGVSVDVRSASAIALTSPSSTSSPPPAGAATTPRRASTSPQTPQQQQQQQQQRAIYSPHLSTSSLLYYDDVDSDAVDDVYYQLEKRLFPVKAEAALTALTHSEAGVAAVADHEDDGDASGSINALFTVLDVPLRLNLRGGFHLSDYYAPCPVCHPVMQKLAAAAAEHTTSTSSSSFTGSTSSSSSCSTAATTATDVSAEGEGDVCSCSRCSCTSLHDPTRAGVAKPAVGGGGRSSGESSRVSFVSTPSSSSSSLSHSPTASTPSAESIFSSVISATGVGFAFGSGARLASVAPPPSHRVVASNTSMAGSNHQHAAQHQHDVRRVGSKGSLHSFSAAAQLPRTFTGLRSGHNTTTNPASDAAAALSSAGGVGGGTGRPSSVRVVSVKDDDDDDDAVEPLTTDATAATMKTVSPRSVKDIPAAPLRLRGDGEHEESRATRSTTVKRETAIAGGEDSGAAIDGGFRAASSTSTSTTAPRADHPVASILQRGGSAASGTLVSTATAPCPSLPSLPAMGYGQPPATFHSAAPSVREGQNLSAAHGNAAINAMAAASRRTSRSFTAAASSSSARHLARYRRQRMRHRPALAVARRRGYRAGGGGLGGAALRSQYSSLMKQRLLCVRIKDKFTYIDPKRATGAMKLVADAALLAERQRRQEEKRQRRRAERQRVRDERRARENKDGKKKKVAQTSSRDVCPRCQRPRQRSSTARSAAATAAAAAGGTAGTGVASAAQKGHRHHTHSRSRHDRRRRTSVDAGSDLLSQNASGAWELHGLAPAAGLVRSSTNGINGVVGGARAETVTGGLDSDLNEDSMRSGSVLAGARHTHQHQQLQQQQQQQQRPFGGGLACFAAQHSPAPKAPAAVAATTTTTSVDGGFSSGGLASALRRADASAGSARAAALHCHVIAGESPPRPQRVQLVSRTAGRAMHPRVPSASSVIAPSPMGSRASATATSSVQCSSLAAGRVRSSSGSDRSEGFERRERSGESVRDSSPCSTTILRGADGRVVRLTRDGQDESHGGGGGGQQHQPQLAHQQSESTLLSVCGSGDQLAAVDSTVASDVMVMAVAEGERESVASFGRRPYSTPLSRDLELSPGGESAVIRSGSSSSGRGGGGVGGGAHNELRRSQQQQQQQRRREEMRAAPTGIASHTRAMNHPYVSPRPGESEGPRSGGRPAAAAPTLQPPTQPHAMNSGRSSSALSTPPLPHPQTFLLPAQNVSSDAVADLSTRTAATTAVAADENQIGYGGAQRLTAAASSSSVIPFGIPGSTTSAFFNLPSRSTSQSGMLLQDASGTTPRSHHHRHHQHRAPRSRSGHSRSSLHSARHRRSLTSRSHSHHRHLSFTHHRGPSLLSLPPEDEEAEAELLNTALAEYPEFVTRSRHASP